MKKWLLGIGTFALAFAMLVTPTDSRVMAADTTVTSGDTGMTVTGNNAGTTTENPKVDLNWDDSWVASWTPVEGAKGYTIYPYKDGRRIEWTNGRITSDTKIDLSQFIDGSGTYQYRVYVKYPESSPCENFSVYSEEKVYVEPEKKLGTTVGYWDNSKRAVFNFPIVEGATQYQILLTEYHVEFDEIGGWKERVYAIVSADSAKNGIVQYEFDNEKLKKWCFNDDGNTVYVRVRALSADTNSVAHGELGEKSNGYDCRWDVDEFLYYIKALNRVGATADEMMNGKSKEREDGLGYEYYYPGIKQFPQYNLKLAMTESESFRTQIDSIMKKYAEEKGIKVGGTAVSDDVSKYIKAEDITVVGAAGNGNAGETVKLEIAMPKQEESINTKMYGRYIQLDLKLTSNSKAISELRVPVTIKMKAPAGIDTSKLVILHYHTSGKAPEIITPVVDGDKIMFSVSKFSTFVFAESVSAGDSDTEDDSTGGTDSGSTGGTGAGSASGDDTDGDKSDSEVNKGEAVEEDDDSVEENLEETITVENSKGEKIGSAVATVNTSALRVAVVTSKDAYNAAVGALGKGEYAKFTVSNSQCGDLAKAAINNTAAELGAKVEHVLDMKLDVRNAYSSTHKTVDNLHAPIEIVIQAPEGVDAGKYDFAVLRLHNGVVSVLPDLDNDSKTITIKSDKFSVYAIVSAPKGTFNAYKAGAVKDSVPKTGDSLPIALPMAMTIVFAGAAVVLRKKVN